MNDFSNFNFISSYEIARGCDVVYSELVTPEEFQKLNLKNYYIISNIDKQIFYKLKSIKLEENNTIFTNLSCVKSLFRLLDKVDLKNIKLITAQSDEPIDYKLFRNKPECVSEWFSVNININQPELKAIPLGISNKYSKKNLLKVNYIDYFKDNKIIEKENLLYVNFQINTNDEARSELYRNFEKESWVKTEAPSLELEQYLKSLSSSHFVLCPFGNGYDTHRLWESLYAGAIPIIEKHPTYEQTTADLPVLIVDDFKEINYNFLTEAKKNILNREFDFTKLDTNYWITIFNEKKIDSLGSVNLNESPSLRLFEKIIFNLTKYKSKIDKKYTFRKKQIMNKLQKIFLN